MVNGDGDRVARTDLRDLYPFQSHWLSLVGASPPCAPTPHASPPCAPAPVSPVRYHYLDEGPRNAPPVVMLHGNPTWSFYYRTLIPAISQEYRVVVPDHVGCGLSDKPQRYLYTLDQHIVNLEALIAHLDLRDLTLVLHDWGGAIGMGYATRHPENVARLVVLNTSAFYVGRPSAPTLPLRIKICRIPVLGDLLVRGLNAFARLALFSALYHRERLTPQIAAGYLLPYDCWRNRIAILRFVQDIPLERRHRTRPTLTQIESSLYLFSNHPMLIIWGARDFCFTIRDFLTGWQERFPYAETRVVQDAGHYIVEDAHERIAPWILEFLASTVLRSQPTPYL